LTSQQLSARAIYLLAITLFFRAPVIVALSQSLDSTLSIHKAYKLQHLAVANAARWLYPIITAGIAVVTIGYWMIGLTSPLLLVEPIVMLASTALLWTMDKENTSALGKVICISFGFNSVVGFIMFGPTTGTGIMWTAWILCMGTFLNRFFLPTVLIGIVFLLGAAFEELQLTPPRMLQSTMVDWLRMLMASSIILGSAAWTASQMQSALFTASEKEAIAQRHRSELETELNKAQRLESLGRLASGVAHDFNNSLAILAVSVDALKYATAEQEKAKILNNIESAIAGGAATTRQLLSMSR
jgi:signal transduction histidine kinase